MIDDDGNNSNSWPFSFSPSIHTFEKRPRLSTFPSYLMETSAALTDEATKAANATLKRAMVTILLPVVRYDTNGKRQIDLCARLHGGHLSKPKIFY